MALRLEGLSVTKPKGLKAGWSESESESESRSLSSVALAMTAVDLVYLVLLLIALDDRDKQVLLEIGEEGW